MCIASLLSEIFRVKNHPLPLFMDPVCIFKIISIILQDSQKYLSLHIDTKSFQDVFPLEGIFSGLVQLSLQKLFLVWIRVYHRRLVFLAS